MLVKDKIKQLEDRASHLEMLLKISSGDNYIVRKDHLNRTKIELQEYLKHNPEHWILSFYPEIETLNTISFNLEVMKSIQHS